ncbi:MAG: o-succinylbenzoate--CoA ligase, partial [Synechococcus sp.]
MTGATRDGDSPPLLLRCGGEPEALIHRLEGAWAQQRTVALADPAEEELLQVALAGAQLPPGPAVLVGSGGSRGGRRWCVQPLEHLQASAGATARWLEAEGIDPAAALLLNPLPLHHVSGLLPLVRARQWGAEQRILPPALLRRPEDLAAACPLPPGRAGALSLVPTQLARLLESQEAVAWLRRCAVIWVGGAALPRALAGRARRLELPLAP